MSDYLVLKLFINMKQCFI